MKFCPQCGAQLPPRARFCVECGAKLAAAGKARPSGGRVTGGNVTIGDVGVLRGNIDASTHISTHIDSQTNIDGDVNIHMGPKEPSAQEIFQKALTALQLKNYPLAIQLFEQYTTKNPTDADGYYYLALARLKGYRPRSVNLSTIRSIESLLRSSTQLDKNCAHAFLLWAIIKQDSYVMSGFKDGTPSVSELFSHARAIKPQHLKEIITQFRATNNKIWQWANSHYKRR